MVEKVIAFPFDAYEKPFNIEVVGKTEYVDEVYTAKHTECHAYIFEYIVKGRGTVIYNHEIYYPKEGDVYILHKSSNNYYYPDGNDPWTKIWFNVDGRLVSSLLAAYDLFDCVLIEGYNNDRYFNELFELANSNQPIQTIMHKSANIFHSLMLSLYEHRNVNLIHSNCNTIKMMLDSNLYQKFSLQTIADKLFISKAQVIRIFKKKYNITPYNYFLKQKIKLSSAMLLNSSLSIETIASILAFADQRYFSNVFKNFMGVSPSEYRKKQAAIYNEYSNILFKSNATLQSPFENK